MKYLRHLEPFQNVTATGRAVLNSKLVLGNVVERVYLVLGGTSFTKAMITAIRVRLNGKVVIGDISGSDLDLVQRYTLNNNNAAYLTIDFTEPTARSVQGQLMGALNTNAAGVNDFTVEVDISGATAPTLDAFVQMRTPADMSPAQGFDPALGPVLRALIPTVVPVTTTSEFQYDVNIGSGGSSLVKRLYVSSQYLTNVRIKKDALDIFEVINPSNNLLSYISSDFARFPQSNFYVVDWMYDGNQSDAVATRKPVGNGNSVASNFQFLFTSSNASTTHKCFADVYSTLAAL